MGIENNGSNGNKGNRGRFSDRLKKMRIERLKKRRGLILDNDKEFSLKPISRNIFKVVLALPSVVYTNVVNNDKVKQAKDANKDIINDKDILFNSEIQDIQCLDLDKDNKLNEIRNINISLLKKKKAEIQKKIKLDQKDIIVVDNINKNLNIEVKKIRLQKEIIELIKKKLVNNINELEILQSDFYVLNQLELGDIYLNQCQQDIKEIKKMLSKIKALKEKYDYLKNNLDFEYMLEFGDDFLIDKILELKELCSSDDIKQTIDDYKILEEYKFLYLKIDKLQEDTIKFEQVKNKKVEELKQRDIDFDKLKEDMYDIDMENDRYNSFVKKQEMLLNEFEENMFHIDSYEKVTYKLKGFNQLLGNSFKYLGLLLVNPLKGVVPGIATQTLVTKNLVHNLYKNLEWEENRRMVYETIDYSSSINFAINNLDSTSSLVDSTLEEIIRLKSKYLKEFSQYESSFSNYHDTIKKINKIENAVLGNKIKIDIMRQRMKEKERENNNKLKMIKKLNDSTNSFGNN